MSDVILEERDLHSCKVNYRSIVFLFVPQSSLEMVQQMLEKHKKGGGSLINKNMVSELKK